MRKKAIIIVVCLLLAAVCTMVINRSANSKYIEVAKTVSAWAASDYIPMGTTITDKHLKEIEIPRHIAQKTGLVTSKEDIVGKFLYTPAFPDVPIYKKQVSPTVSADKPGYKKVGIPVTQSSSDQAVAGDRVDVYPIAGANQYAVDVSGPIATDVHVVASYDQNGRIIAPYTDSGGLSAAQTNVPSMVEIEVPDESVSAVVGYASLKQIYLVRR